MLPTYSCERNFLELPREVRDIIYSSMITTVKVNAYNDCAIGVARDFHEFQSMRLVCKQIASEFSSILYCETRVALRVNLDEKELSDVVNTVRESVRKQAHALAINIEENTRPPIPGITLKIHLRQKVADAVINAIKAFPRVRDVAISVQLKGTANTVLIGLLQEGLEKIPELKEYRVYTHALPSFRQYPDSRDFVRGRCAILWKERTMDEGRRWMERVIDHEQFSTQLPVWDIFS